MGNVPQDNMTCSHITNAGIYRNDGQPMIENDTDYNKYSCVQCNPPSRIQVKEKYQINFRMLKEHGNLSVYGFIINN